MSRTHHENLMALLQASNTLARRTPAESAARLDALFRPALEAEFMRNLIDNTLAEAHAEHRLRQQRLAHRGGPVQPSVSMDDIAIPQGDLTPHEGEGLPTGLLGLMGFEPVIVTKPNTPEDAQAAFADGVAQLQQREQQAGTE